MSHIPGTGPLHFIGIGGIGMSGIAEVLSDSGFTVTGSDSCDNANVKRLRAKGIHVSIGHAAAHVEGAAVVVTSSAIKGDNPELIQARALNIPVIRRAEMLAELMRLRQSICISGTHGKTTTTSLCAALMDSAGADPTVVHGGIINAYGTNARLGSGKWFVVEADESDGSFLKIPPTIAVITNIDAEHMEHYGTFDKLVSAFDTFVHNTPFYGLAILCSDHAVVKSLADRVTDRRKLTYGLEPGADIQAINIRMRPEGATFDVVINPTSPVIKAKTLNWLTLKDIQLPLYGKHNIQNALVVVAVAIEMGYAPDIILQALAQFSGVKRRFTRVGEVSGSIIVDDYAHHPVEIDAVLRAARYATKCEVIAVVQIHRYTRLSHLFEQFVDALHLADRLVICPIYSAGEAPIEGISDIAFAQALKRAYPNKPIDSVGNETELTAHLHMLLSPTSERPIPTGSMIVCMGAGSISQWANQLPTALNALLQISGETHVAK